MRSAIQPRPPQPARGVATLTIVMVLFFIMAMVAAYANRNLIFEQRTSANNYRSTQAMDAAEAGVDWAIAMLSGGRSDAQCVASANAGDTSFRQRYLRLGANGGYTATAWNVGAGDNLFRPSCVLNAGVWSCSCPTAGDPVLAAPANGAAPVFTLAITTDGVAGNPGSPGLLQLRVRGCSNLGTGATACHLTSLDDFPAVDASVKLSVALGLARALPVPPVAALTAGAGIAQDAGVALRVSNPDPNTGVAVHVGTAVTADTRQFAGPPGSTAPVVLDHDAAQHTLSTDGTLFQALFGMNAQTFKRQPAAVRVDCGADGNCDSADLAPVLAANPGRLVWVDGNLTLDADATLGSAAQPAMLIVDGDITLAATLTINGFVYANRDITWQAGAAASVVNGAVVAARDFIGQGTTTVTYDADILRRISLGYGSFVRVPGSWAVQ